MSDTYILKHTAEELDRKLYLIDENKNLLPYPYRYTTTLPAGLVDVGDGSFLAVANTPFSNDSVFLTADAELSAGTYTASIEVTDIFDITKSGENYGFTFTITDSNNGSSIEINEYNQFNLTADTVITVSLGIPMQTFDTDLVIKPQIEAGSVKTDWVPNMDKIGTYVDRRFNGINTRLKKLGSTTLEEADYAKLLEMLDAVEIEYDVD